MLRTQVSDDTSGGAKFVVPANLREGVERANRILESELLSSLDFEIDAHWKFVSQQSDRVAVTLDLTTPYEGNRVGITGYPLDADVFVDDTHIRHGLNRPTWNFTSLLSYVNKMNVKRVRQELGKLVPISED